jgi:6-phosphogluconate dehydrogenase (decarboxylating)
MSWVKNFKLFQREDKTITFSGEIENSFDTTSKWSVKDAIESNVINHFTNKAINQLAEEMAKEFTIKEILEATREGFIEKVKNKFIKE